MHTVPYGLAYNAFSCIRCNLKTNLSMILMSRPTFESGLTSKSVCEASSTIINEDQRTLKTYECRLPRKSSESFSDPGNRAYCSPETLGKVWRELYLIKA
jgi:hypothetical protein